jgi:prepilin-type N-terminal cleavage/methylation domain-containing protein
MSQSVHPRNADAEKGFSLLEVVVAILVLTIGLMSAAMLMANVYKFTVRSRYVGMATQLASEELEDLNRWPAPLVNGIPNPDPHIAVPLGSNTCGIPGAICVGSLLQDCNSTSTPIACGNNANVSYFDTVSLSTQNGTMSETYEMPCTGAPAGTGNFLTISYSPQGLTPNSLQNPALCNVSPPSVGMTFDRRWVIEQDQPVAGVRRITVLVTLVDKTIQPSVTFQMSMVRP